MCFIKFTFYYQWDLLSITFMVLLHRQLGTSTAFYCHLLHKTSMSSKFLPFYLSKREAVGASYTNERWGLFGAFSGSISSYGSQLPLVAHERTRRLENWVLGSQTVLIPKSQKPRSSCSRTEGSQEKRATCFFFLVYATRMLNFADMTICQRKLF